PGDRLRAEQLGGPGTLPGAGLSGDRQQPERADAARRGPGAEQLGGAGQRGGGRDGGGAVHDGAELQAPGDRSPGLCARGADGAVRPGREADGGATVRVAAGPLAVALPATRAGASGRLSELDTLVSPLIHDGQGAATACTPGRAKRGPPGAGRWGKG